jgi:hypothetical protein
MLIKKIPLAFILLFVYLFASWYFAFERILNVDNSYFFFQIVNNHSFWFPENRIGIFLSQLPLLFFSGIGASMNALIHIYSLAFPVEYIIIAAICHYYLKVKEAALAIALCLIIGVAYSFLHPVTETYHALVFSVLLYAVLVSDVLSQHRFGYYLAVFVAAALSLISHPIGVFTTAFISIFTILNKQVKIYPSLFIISLALLSMVLRLLLVPKGSYDIQQYDNLFTSLKSFNKLGNLYPIVYLKAHSDSVYFSTGLLLVVFSLLAITTKRLSILLLSIFGSSIFVLIGVLTFSKGDSDMMMEKTFLPAIFMIILPFCYLFFKEAFWSKVTLSIVILMLSSISFHQIIQASNIATKRLNTLQEISDISVHPKLIADFNDFDEPTLKFNHWNTSIDSYILAKCKLNKEFTLFLVDQKDSFKYDTTNLTLVLGPVWFPYWDEKMLDTNYFNLPDVAFKRYHNE